MAVDTQWFRDRLSDRRMSQRGLARQLGIDPAAVSLTLRGKREMKIAEAAAIARLLGVPADEVMEHAGVSISSGGVSVSLCSYMDESAEVHACQEVTSIPHPGGDLPPHVVGIQCRTAGSDLDHMDRWVLFTVKPMVGGVQADAVGRLSLVRLRNGVLYVAKVTRGIRRGRWTLSSPIGVMHDIEVEWATPILLVQP